VESGEKREFAARAASAVSDAAAASGGMAFDQCVDVYDERPRLAMHAAARDRRPACLVAAIPAHPVLIRESGHACYRRGVVALPESAEPQAFKAFEHERWQSAARVYDAEFGRLTSQIAPFLLDAAGVTRGVRMLDLASGPGYVAAGASARGAKVTGTDFASEMLALAREQHPGLTFEVADAEALPFGEGEFEAATMGFLVGHLGRPAVAVREACRVLRRGGRLAIAWWLPPQRCIPFAIVTESIRTRGRMDVGLPPAPPFELFGDPAMLHALLSESGFSGVESVEVPMVWRLDTAEEMFDAYLNGTARTAGALRRQTPEALAAIRAEVIARCAPFRTTRGLELPMPAHVASGIKP